MNYKCYLRNSLDTIFVDSDITGDNLLYTKMLKNEAFSFQLAVKPEKSDADVGCDTVEMSIEINSPIAEFVSVYTVENVPAVRVGYGLSDDWFIRRTPGIYPDRMKRYNGKKITVPVGYWRCLRINVNETLENISSGIYDVSIILYEKNKNDKIAVSKNDFRIEVLDAALPKQRIKFTNWLHYDCIAYFSNTKPLSAGFFETTKKYIKLAAKNGQNMIYTPCFTPPLDTPENEERMTIQLVGVKTVGSKYEFDFDNLKKFIDICLDCGIEYLEHSHMYTQWGAKHAPKIVANVDGVDKVLFGWKTDAMSDEYKTFVSSYLAALKSFMKQNNCEERFFFHVSDEPEKEHLESYAAAAEYFAAQLGDYPCGDALSEYKFYQEGLVRTPVAALENADDFVGKVKPLWLYYTGLQSHDNLSNRLIGMPEERNRILGIQLYYYDIDGFLNWGFNAHHNRLSRDMIDPAVSCDMGGDFVAGTSYLVYPDKNEVDASVRLMTFRDQVQDTRALCLLESMIGKESVCKLIDSYIPNMSFNCRVSANQLLDLRENVNILISRNIKKHN